MTIQELINTKLDSLNIKKEDKDLLNGLISALLYEKDMFIEQTAIADKENQKLSDTLTEVLDKINIFRNCLYIMQKDGTNANKANTIDAVIKLFEDWFSKEVH